MVVLILAIAWAGVLVAWLRSRSRGSFGDSVGMFHRHLHVLERTAPATLAPANRLRGPAVSSTPLSTRLGGPRVARVAPSARRSARHTPAPRPVPRAYGAAGAGGSLARRRQTRKRRRDVLFVLLVLVVATLVLAAGTGRHALVLVQLASDLVLAGYVGLLVRLRNLSLERRQKLRVLHRPARGRLAAGDFGDLAGVPSGYGDLALRRVAN